MRRSIIFFAAGILFAVGLSISGMTMPEKVIGFLDVFGKWDPALAFVMVGAIAVYSVGHFFIVKRKAPLLAEQFSLPTRKDLNPRLIIGSMLFGMGWGLGGFCPGPALTSVATNLKPVWIFVGSMVGGMFLFYLMDSVLQKLPQKNK